MEAKLTALDTSGVEAGWLRDLLMDLPLVDKPVPTILMNCDNQTIITKVLDHHRPPELLLRDAG